MTSLTPREASLRLLSAILPGAEVSIINRVDLVIRPADYPKAVIEITIIDAGQVEGLVRVIKEINPELAARIDTAWGELKT